MKSPVRVIVMAVFASLVLLACSDDEPDFRARPDVTLTSSPVVVTPPPPEVPSPVVEGDCPNQAEVASNALSRVAGPLIGDVTGDATPERVYLSLDSSGPAGCQAFVVVAETTTVSAPIEGWDPSAGIASPTLNGLVQIDGRPGAEIVVNLAAGASTQFVGVFSASGGTIERVVTTGDDQTSGGADLFAYGGSVGHLEAADCTTDGLIVLSSAIPKANRYQVNRRFFLPSGATLELQAAASRRSVVTLNELEDFPEFRASPFGTCPAS